MASLAARTNTKIYQKEDTPCAKASNTEAWMSTVHLRHPPSKAILARTNHWNVLNIWTTCIETTRTKQTQKKISENIQDTTSRQSAGNLFPCWRYYGLKFTSHWHVTSWKACQRRQTWNVRQTAIQAPRLPPRRRPLGELNDCTAASGARDSGS